MRITTVLEPSLTTTSTVQYTLTSAPPGVEVNVRYWARDTHGNATPASSLTTWTASDLVNPQLETDFLNPAPNPYAHRLQRSVALNYTLTTSLPVTVRVYHPESGATVRTWTTTGEAGSNRVSWDGTDMEGVLVDAGGYAVRLETSAAGRPKSISNSLFFRVQY
jgi:hypothetical protein